MAKRLQAPVLAVVDASGMARTAAALARRLASFDPDLEFAGVFCNRVGSRGHLLLLREALEAAGVRLLGSLPVRAELALPERHLGLRTADDSVLPDKLLDAWGAAAAQWLDLDQVLDAGRAAPPVAIEEGTAPQRAEERCRIGIAFDEAFHFDYECNLARLVRPDASRCRRPWEAAPASSRVARQPV